MNRLNQWVMDIKEQLTEKDNELLNAKRSETMEYDEDKYNEAVNDYLSRINWSNLSADGYDISVDIHTKYMIPLLFQEYVDEDTYTITSSMEHDLVKEIFNNLPADKKIQHDDFNESLINELIMRIKLSGCHKVFIYYITTGIVTGVPFPQAKLKLLRNRLEEEGLSVVMVADDRYGMFWIPRDYRLFDYIIGTANTNTLFYDIGFFIYRKGMKQIGSLSSNWLGDWIPSLDTMLKFGNKIHELKVIIEDILKDNLEDGSYTINANTNDYFVSVLFNNPLKIFKSELQELDDNNFELDPGRYLLRVHCSQYLYFPVNVIHGMSLFLDIIHNRHKEEESGESQIS